VSETADVLVVGGGLTGAAAAWALTERSAGRVIVLERHTVGSGGTGKSSGIVRCHYGVRSLAAMAWAGVQFFENARDVVGEDIGFHQCGYVVGVTEPNLAALHANLDTQRSVGVEVRLVGHDEVAAMWPWAQLEEFAAFGYEPRGGYGDAYRTAQAFGAAARRSGASVRQGAAVAELLVSSDRVDGVRLADGSRLRAATVVVAAGPWSAPLLAAVGVDLPISVYREEIIMVSPGVKLGRPPVFSDLASLQYIRPEPSGELLLGNSDLSDPEPADPDRYSNLVRQVAVDRGVERLAARLPGLTGAAITAGYAGCYDVTPDWNPVISRTGIDGLVVAAGFSGHGFKISPAVGTLVADLVCDGRSSNPEIPETDFRLTRFADDAPLLSPNPYLGATQMR
jgi:glycine/D-amino acid oxidase-like deaminating enzyme